MKTNRYSAIISVILILFAVFCASIVTFAEGEAVTAITGSGETVEEETKYENVETASNEAGEESEVKDMGLKICIPEFIDSLGIMLIGLLGIFAVTGLIILSICVLNKLTKKSE